MSCDEHRDNLAAWLEPAATAEDVESCSRHLDRCDSCRAAVEAYRAIRARLGASAAAMAPPALEHAVMARIVSSSNAATHGVRASKTTRRFAGALAWRLAFGTAGLVVLMLLATAVFLRQPTHAWTIEQSIDASRPFRALHLRGVFGGNASCELWTRVSSDHTRSEKLLIRIGRGGPTIWTEGNSTHYYDPASRTVSTDDAVTAGFNPWPGPHLLELARAAGVRMVDTRWRFPNRRTVVTEWSLLLPAGPTSAVAEFDVDSKLIVSLRQWDNMDRRGAPGFQSDDITFLRDLPNDVFEVRLPAGVQHQPRPVEVADSALGLLSMEGTGIPAPDLSLGESARRVVTEMWETVLKRDLPEFKRLCPMTRGWSDEFLGAILGPRDVPDAIAEVVTVEPGVTRGHSRLGPVTVVTSRVRRNNGGLYEEKTIVQHRLAGPVPSCVVYAPYGQPYRLD